MPYSTYYGTNHFLPDRQPIDTPGFAVPEKFTSEVFNQLDKVIEEHLGRARLLTPEKQLSL